MQRTRHTTAMALIAATTAGVLALAGCSGPTATGADPSTGAPATTASPATSASISAQGVGTASGVPDTVTMQIGVETRNASAKAAIEENSAKAKQLVATFKSAGIADKDIQTSQLYVNPDYNNSGKPTGYVVNNMLTVKITGIDKAGPLIDQAGKAAGDAIRLQGLSFGFSDDSAVMAKARADAVRQARTQATQLAEAAGVKLGAVKSIVEQPGGGMAMPYASMAAAGDSSAAMPIQAGSVDLAVTVQVVYEITS